MKYLSTVFSISLCGLRLRLRIDLDEEPEDVRVPNVRVCAPGRTGARERAL